jgi:hypothetical protein
MAPGQVAAFDQAVSAWRAACRAFAYMTGTGDAMFAAEAAMRQAGLDAEAGLVTVPVAAVRFSDVRADGARMRAVNGSLLGGDVWVTWSGRSLPCGIESRSYGPADLVQVKARP